MYSDVFGMNSCDIRQEFDYYPSAMEEFESELKEAPIDKPYEFCADIKHAGGE
jgi:hypothetical protein